MWNGRQACKCGSTLLSSMAQSVACSLQSNYAGQQLPGIDAACLSMACAVLRPMQNDRLMLFFAQCMAGAVSCFKICIINASCLPTRSRYLKEHCCTPAAKHAEGVLYLWRHAGDYSVFFLVQGRQTPFLPTDNDHAMGVGGTVRESPLHCWTVSSHHALTACA